MNDVQYKVGDLVVFKTNPDDEPQIVREMIMVGLKPYIRTDKYSRITAVKYRRPSPVAIAKYRCENEV